MDLGIKGRVALVAASSSGLGLAVAKAFAAEGAHVSICGRDPARLAKAHAEVNAAGPGDVLSVPVDIRDEHAAAAWVRHTADVFGGLDIVVTNTGGVPFGPVDSFEPADYREAVDGNLLPHVSITLAALPILKAAGWGRIVMIASEAVKQPSPASGLSSVARLGLLGHMKGLVHALGANGVTVNVIAPGYHRTPILDEQFGDHVEDELARVARGIPLGRIGDAGHFGALVAMLSGDQASYVTGTVLVADGGNTRGIG
ncbi:SDR family oxidoreductase [Saccharothrix violaceirubra]|uniref:3-oxoacyl-[acyl-carrier protein] reductase n=1 Tax=Saccharothrix violaceirubra TaxID=413306 RepID=A0A7W7WXT2_9PSEU|nr:SDR family oxidoreductase [Saccharothrix violaceirubra]MBB4967381.1 3-oxoacyl-[acyl-carrier protein] reductase [Saccharothrix violaceirubra]